MDFGCDRAKDRRGGNGDRFPYPRTNAASPADMLAFLDRAKGEVPTVGDAVVDR